MPGSSQGSEEYFPQASSGLSARVLPGWMGREQAIKFLTEDCVFSPPLTSEAAEEIWKSHRVTVDNLGPWEASAPRRIPYSETDLKAIRKFRKRHPDAESVVDFVKLNPLDLVVHQLWVSTTIADGYREAVRPDKWLQTALLDPPSNTRLNWRREDQTILIDLPHSEFFLAGPMQPSAQLRVSEAPGYISVALHGDRALLLTGYHRTFACVQSNLHAVNAPRGVLFAVSNQLAELGSQAEDILSLVETPRPPRMADFCDERLFLAVTLRRRRYQMRIRYEVAEIDHEIEEEAAAPLVNQRTVAPTPIQPTQPGGPYDFPGMLTTAMKHYQAGRLHDAAAQYRHALAIKPNYAEGHVALGGVLKELGQLHEAEDLFKRALALKPDSAEACNALGVSFVEQGKFEDAAIYCERALGLKPNFTGAHNTLGIALASQGMLDEATAHYREALALDPDQPEVLNNLGRVLKDEGKFNDSMAHFRKALEISPACPESHFSLAEIKTFRSGDAELAALEALAGENLPPPKAIYIHFALAKALEDIGDYGRAFEHLRKGNDLKRRQIAYDEMSALQLLERIQNVFDISLFDRLRGEGDTSPAPIFVLGMPRSGSTLVEQILASHPGIRSAGERGYLEKATRSISSACDSGLPYPESLSTLDGARLRKLGQSYLSSLRRPANGTLRMIDKTPQNFMLIGLIRLILPKARIIHTMRNPIDTCVSCFSKLFLPGQVHFSYDLAELGRYYRGYSELMAHWRSVLAPGSLMEVCYENVVDDLEGQARRLIDYCGLPWDDRCLEFHSNGLPVSTASSVQVRKPLFRTSIQRWRRYEDGLAPLLRELVGLAGVAGVGGEGISARPLSITPQCGYALSPRLA